MTGCERCNTVNTAKRHVYIVLFKGDDSDFAWNQNIEVTLETEMDLTGFRAKFSFMDFTQEFADITSKKLVLVFPATATASFPLGAADASIVLYDSDGKARTIANRIHMIVTKCVDEAYANEDPQAITVSISSSREQADWDETDTQSPSYIRNKPKIPSIDATLTQSGEAADAKTVGDELDGKRELTDLAVYEPAGAWDGTDGAQTYRFTLKSESTDAILWATSDDPATAIRLTWWADDGGYWTLDVPEVGTGYLQQPDDARELEFEVSGATWNLTRGVEKTTDSIAKTSQIPAAVTIDATLTEQGAAADAKAVGDALRSGFTPWEFSGYSEGVEISEIVYDGGNWWRLELDYGGSHYSPDVVSGPDATELYFRGQYKEPEDTIRAVRHLITPTKTSQLTNDGAPNGGGTPYATTAQIPTVPSAYTSTPAMDGVGSAGSSGAWARGDHVHPSDTSKADKAVPSVAGNLASLTETGNLADCGVKPSDFAAKADLPYALVTPGEWEFSDGRQYDVYVDGDGDEWFLMVSFDGISTSIGSPYSTEAEANSVLSFSFNRSILGLDDENVTATRPSLPGHLLDRAGNRVVVSGDTTLTLPAANPGYLRDFLVRLEISGSTVPTITFAAPTGETITYETDGDEFPVPDEAGDWLYSFTESCVAHKFAVALKKVNEVAAPQAQGGA